MSKFEQADAEFRETTFGPLPGLEHGITAPARLVQRKDGVLQYEAKIGRRTVDIGVFESAPTAPPLLYDPATGQSEALPTARKDDSGKLDMNLLDDMPRAIKAVVEVMQWAIVDKKPVPYERGSWLGVEPDRYRAAIKRHERSAAEQATADVPARFQRDPETNLLHLAHTACSAMMALENALREQEARNG